jgi:hypothetical protein
MPLEDSLPVDFESNLKERLFEVTFASLLENCGYKVVPVGLEHSLREVGALSRLNPQMHERLVRSLHKLPGCLVMDIASNTFEPRFVTVKVRGKSLFAEDLEQIMDQAVAWSTLHFVVFLTTPAKTSSKFNSPEYCRVFTLERHVGSNQATVVNVVARNGAKKDLAHLHWLDGIPLEESFQMLKKGTEKNNIKTIISVMRSIWTAADGTA